MNKLFTGSFLLLAITLLPSNANSNTISKLSLTDEEIIKMFNTGLSDPIDEIRRTCRTLVNKFGADEIKSQLRGLIDNVRPSNIEDRDYFYHNVSKIIKNREKLFLTLQNWGWKTYESGANFLFTRPVDSFGNYGASIAKKAFEFLRENQIFIRYFPEHDLTSSYLRISIGKQEELDMLTECLQKWQTIDQRV